LSNTRAVNRVVVRDDETVNPFAAGGSNQIAGPGKRVRGGVRMTVEFDAQHRSYFTGGVMAHCQILL